MSPNLTYMRSKVSLSKRIEVFNRYQGKCAYCGADLHKVDFTIDHIVPRSRVTAPKQNAVANLNPCCHACNKHKQNLSLDEFRKRVLWMDGILIGYYQWPEWLERPQETTLFYYELAYQK